MRLAVVLLPPWYPLVIITEGGDGDPQEQGLAAWDQSGQCGWESPCSTGAATTGPVRSDAGKMKEIVCPEHGSFGRGRRSTCMWGYPKCSGLGRTRWPHCSERYPGGTGQVSITNKQDPINPTCSIPGAFTDHLTTRLANRREGLSAKVCPSCNRASEVQKVPTEYVELSVQGCTRGRDHSQLGHPRVQ